MHLAYRLCTAVCRAASQSEMTNAAASTMAVAPATAAALRFTSQSVAGNARFGCGARDNFIRFS